ncbi:Barrierpepsin [Drechslerella dactyloides]|uniref:Barrierpepsin n=1 Tax=Drechslerella dactyloides TaxID=74499 RepID=A0AAD6J375_DREDA|nr:Barrierpepsin [Drechslerella dactyloides]
MFSNTNTIPLLAVSSLLLLGQLCEGRAIPMPTIARRDVSDTVRRDHGNYRRDAKGLVQPIWLSDDGLMYYTNVSFGTPPQPLTLALSMTGTTWAPTLPAGKTAKSFCADNANALACEYAQISGFYTIPSSITYSPKDNVTSLYVDSKDTINGTQGVDTIKLGTTALANVGIAVAEAWRSPPQLSLSPTPATNESGPQLLAVLKQARIINTLTYSLSFGSADDEGNVNYGTGKISFGGVDESQFVGELGAFTSNGPAAVVPMSDVYWIDAAGKNVSIVDGGSQAGQLGVGEISLTPYLWLQDSMFDIIVSLFADATRTNTGAYTCNCSANVQSLQLSLDRTMITIPSAMLLEETASPGNCMLAIRPLSDYTAATTADYILGFPFLRAAYTVLDHTNGQTLVAPRRVVTGASATTITPIGINDAAVSASGAAPASTNVQPATNTLTAALSLQTKPSTTKTSGAPRTTTSGSVQQLGYPRPRYNLVGPVVGGVVGGVVFIALVIVFRPLVKATIRRRRRRDRDDREMAMQRRRVSDSTIMAPIDVASISEGDDDDDDEKDAELIAAAIAMSISDHGGDPPDERDPGEAKRDSITIDIHGGMEPVDVSMVGVAITSPPEEETETETESDKESEDEGEDEKVKEAPRKEEENETKNATTHPDDGDGQK